VSAHTAIDNQLYEARQMLAAVFGDREAITEHEALTLIRLAYGKGYTDALREPDRDTRARMAEQLGLLDRETGELL
jgi:hypothetical protein